jgi:hypothetical protein
MNRKKHKLEVDPAYRLTRRLKLVGPVEHHEKAVIEEIDGLFGVDNVSITNRKTLVVVYDGTLRKIDDIREILERYGLRFGNDWITRFKMNWYRSTDQNVRANASHEPHCCSKSPK